MTKTHTRVGVCAQHRVVRRLRLDTLADDRLRPALTELDGLFGMDDVSLNPGKRRLTVAYDATRLDIDAVLAVLKRHAVGVHAAGWHRLRLGYYRSVDQNVNDNAHHEPWNCH